MFCIMPTTNEMWLTVYYQRTALLLRNKEKESWHCDCKTGFFLYIAIARCFFQQVKSSVIFASCQTKSTYFNSQYSLLKPQTREIFLWPSSPLRHMESIRSITFPAEEIQSPFLHRDKSPADNLTKTCQYIKSVK